MTSPLITSAQLADLIAQRPDNLIIADSRHDLMTPEWGREAFEQGHIPGAIFVSIDEDLSGTKTGRNGRHPLPSVPVAAQNFGKMGISNNSQVVVYDQGSGMFAGRLWWMLRWLGHENVKVLDGGISQWKKQGYGLDSGVGKPHPSTTFVAHEQQQMLRNAAQTLQTLGDGEHLILDARAPERYRGEVEPMDAIAGHIPGALNRPFTHNLDNGVFKPAQQLRTEFLALLGGTLPHAVIHQCGSGVSAANNLLAMAHAGLEGSQLYAGSWSEWCSDASRPVAVGEN